MRGREASIDGAAAGAGMQLNTVSEILKVHDHESKAPARAVAGIAGIKVNHDLMDEGLLVDKIGVEMQPGRPIYDCWMNDSDFTGTHPRCNDIVQQFASPYWFQRPELKAASKKQFGYELGVPVNWSAYEDIADFFTDTVKEIDGQRAYGHMDYGKKDPSLGWRSTDARLSMAGAGDRGLPNGKPVDEWGIRIEDSIPRGSSITRGGDANGPAAVHALAKRVEWLKECAPPEAAGMDFLESGPVPGQSRIAQQIFWYSAFTDSLTKPGLPAVDEDGTPKRRMAPSPHGPCWKEGMKLGYQDCGCWTMLKYAPTERIKAGWLYAQFCTSKTVTLKKALVSLRLIRESDVWHQATTDLAPKVGGPVEFCRSPTRKQWTPTGVNVPDNGKTAQAWWQNVSNAISGAVTPQQAMDGPARDQDAIMTRLQRSGAQGKAGPAMNPEKDAEHWFARAEKDGNLAPQRKPANEKPQGETVDCETPLKAWAATPMAKRARPTRLDGRGAGSRSPRSAPP